MITLAPGHREAVTAGLIGYLNDDHAQHRSLAHCQILLLERCCGIDLGYTFTLRRGLPWAPDLEVTLDDLDEAMAPSGVTLPQVLLDRLDSATALFEPPSFAAIASDTWLRLIASVALLAPEFGYEAAAEILAERLVSGQCYLDFAISWCREHVTGGKHQPVARLGTAGSAHPEDIASVTRALGEVVAMAKLLGLDITATLEVTPTFDRSFAAPALQEVPEPSSAPVVDLPDNVFPIHFGVAV